MYDVIIIGAGVIGGFIARELSKYTLKVLVIEKENDVGNMTSNANSAVIHAGYDPIPNTLKARFNVEGAKMYPRLSEELDVKYLQIGSLLVGRKEEDFATIEELFERGKSNGVDVRIIENDELHQLEPNLNDEINIGLLAKDAGVIDPFNLVVHCFENAIDNGVILHLNEIVTDIIKVDNGYVVKTTKDSYRTRIVVNASGVNSDEVNELVNNKSFTISPNKGEYFVLDHFDNDFVHHIIFPMPSKKGKGVLITPTSSYNFLIGPSSDFIDDKIGNDTNKSTLDNIRLKASSLVKKIPFGETVRIFSGIRPKSDRGDFIVEVSDDGFINVAGIESPGLASAPAIGKYVVTHLVSSMLTLIEKDDYNPNVKKYIVPRYLSLEEREKVVESNPLYGHIICRCEQVSEGEIREVLSRSCPPHSIKGIKKRTRAGFGKCQGGICQPLVATILSNHYNCSLLDVYYDGEDSPIVAKESKGVCLDEND